MPMTFQDYFNTYNKPLYPNFNKPLYPTKDPFSQYKENPTDGNPVNPNELNKYKIDTGTLLDIYNKANELYKPVTVSAPTINVREMSRDEAIRKLGYDPQVDAQTRSDRYLNNELDILNTALKNIESGARLGEQKVRNTSQLQQMGLQGSLAERGLGTSGVRGLEEGRIALGQSQALGDLFTKMVGEKLENTQKRSSANTKAKELFDAYFREGNSALRNIIDTDYNRRFAEESANANRAYQASIARANQIDKARSDYITTQANQLANNNAEYANLINTVLNTMSSYGDKNTRNTALDVLANSPQYKNSQAYLDIINAGRWR